MRCGERTPTATSIDLAEGTLVGGTAAGRGAEISWSGSAGREGGGQGRCHAGVPNEASGFEAHPVPDAGTGTRGPSKSGVETLVMALAPYLNAVEEAISGTDRLVVVPVSISDVD